MKNTPHNAAEYKRKKAKAALSGINGKNWCSCGVDVIRYAAQGFYEMDGRTITDPWEALRAAKENQLRLRKL